MSNGSKLGYENSVMHKKYLASVLPWLGYGIVCCAGSYWIDHLFAPHRNHTERQMFLDALIYGIGQASGWAILNALLPSLAKGQNANRNPSIPPTTVRLLRNPGKFLFTATATSITVVSLVSVAFRLFAGFPSWAQIAQLSLTVPACFFLGFYVSFAGVRYLAIIERNEKADMVMGEVEANEPALDAEALALPSLVIPNVAVQEQQLIQRS